MKMKVTLLLIASCLLVNNGHGAPRTAVYKYVRCSPEGDQTNCVTHQSQPLPWSEDLPDRLPASTAQYLDAGPVEDEHPPEEEGADWISVTHEEGESPQPEEGSGGFYEGSAFEWPYIADQGIDGGSGESWTKGDMDLYKGGALRRLFRGKSMLGRAKPAEQELREDNLLQL